MSPLPEATPQFPILKWFGTAFLVVLVICYWEPYGPANFLQMCDIALLLTVIGWWTGSSLLLSSQILACFIVDAIWCADLGARLATGHYIYGGTNYMFMENIPLFTRLLSLFHVAWTPLLLYSIRKTGYDRRALAFQCVLLAVLLPVSAWVGLLVNRNVNYALADPFTGAMLSPLARHLAVSWFVGCLVLFGPLHGILLWFFPRPAGRPGGPEVPVRKPAPERQTAGA